MSIENRLREVRGLLSRKEFATRMGIHANSVANYENGRDPPASYIARVAERQGVAVGWLLEGAGQRDRGAAAQALDARRAYAIASAIHRAFGDDLNVINLDDRARLLEATNTYLVTIGVTESLLPAMEPLEELVRLTASLLGIIGSERERTVLVEGKPRVP